jgi:predicted AAA+ superfamily ATPase
VFSEFFKNFALTAQEPPLFFWRDRSGHEIDLVVDLGGRSIPLEIKLGTSRIPEGPASSGPGIRVLDDPLSAAEG